jgi:hypothetical protein
VSSDSLVSSASGLAVRAGLSYVAWTQIIPAVLVWMFACIFLVALWLVGLDARDGNPATFMQVMSERFPNLSSGVAAWFEAKVAPSIEEATNPETGAVNLDEIDFWGAASYVWFWLSLAGALLGMLWRFVFGPLPQRSLRQKLLLALGACAVLSFVFFIALNFLPPSFEGTVLSWLGIAISVGLFVLVVTSWSVLCAHALGRLADVLVPPPEKPSGLLSARKRD